MRDLPPAPELYEQVARVDGTRGVRLVDAPRCPYCARVRIALAEKGLEHETVVIDLSDRPPWVYELNATGRVPILEDGFTLPESEVIMAYLDERYPESPLARRSAARAQARLLVHRFDDNLGRDYYAFRRGDENDLPGKLEALEVGRASSRTSRMCRG